MRVTVNPERGFIESVTVDNTELIKPWSIEFADSKSFFSLENKGWRVLETSKKILIENNKVIGKYELELSDGKCRLEFEDSWKENQVARKATFTALSDMYLIDFVQQYRFNYPLFEKGIINSQEYLYKNSNTYYQFETDNISALGEDYKAEIRTISYSAPKNFSRKMYVRDFKNMWICHSRLFPNKGDKQIIKINKMWYNKAIPQFISTPLLSIKPFKDYIWYRGERKPYKKWNVFFKYLNITGYNLVYIPKDTVISLESLCGIKSS